MASSPCWRRWRLAGLADLPEVVAADSAPCPGAAACPAWPRAAAWPPAAVCTAAISGEGLGPPGIGGRPDSPPVGLPAVSTGDSAGPSERAASGARTGNLRQRGCTRNQRRSDRGTRRQRCARLGRLWSRRRGTSRGACAGARWAEPRGFGPGPLAAGAGGIGAGPLAAGGPLTAGRLGGFLGLPSDEGLHNLGANAAGVQRPGHSRRRSRRRRRAIRRLRGGDNGHRARARRSRARRRGRTLRRRHGRSLRRRRCGGVRRGLCPCLAVGALRDRRHRPTRLRGLRHLRPRLACRHPAAWYATNWEANSGWDAATWNVLDVWLYESAIQPVYYDYGQTVTYQDDAVDVNGQDAGTPEEYSQQAADLAAAGAQAEAPADGEWLPLGVFALTKTGETQSDVVLQLAVNKQGVIRGNSTDTKTGQTQLVQGSVDKAAQRVAFTVGDNTSTVVETGLYNLTKDEAPVLIHFGGDRTEQWLLVRLQESGGVRPPAGRRGRQSHLSRLRK